MILMGHQIFKIKLTLKGNLNIVFVRSLVSELVINALS